MIKKKALLIFFSHCLFYSIQANEQVLPKLAHLNDLIHEDPLSPSCNPSSSLPEILNEALQSKIDCAKRVLAKHVKIKKTANDFETIGECSGSPVYRDELGGVYLFIKNLSNEMAGAYKSERILVVALDDSKLYLITREKIEKSNPRSMAFKKEIIYSEQIRKMGEVPGLIPIRYTSFASAKKSLQIAKGEDFQGVVISRYYNQGDLFHSPLPTLNRDIILSVAKQLTNGTLQLANYKIYTQDIKPANVVWMMDEKNLNSYRVAHIDFGIGSNSTIFPKKKQNQKFKEELKLSKALGTPYFAPPEAFSIDKKEVQMITPELAEKREVYSLGLTLWHILFFNDPWPQNIRYLGKNADLKLLLIKAMRKNVDTRISLRQFAQEVMDLN